MKPERFKRTKSVMASSAIALVVAALTFGVSSAVLRPAASPFAATQGSAFTISSAIYASPACSGSTVLLYPGTTDCAVLTIKNNLSVPMTVQSLSTTVSSPPAGCPASDFELPTFNGSLSVPANGAVSTSGLPISLIDTGTNEDACEGLTINFAYTGSAQYTDSTSTALTASPSAPASGEATTLTATVTGNDASNDPSTPTGTVTFNSCSDATCSSIASLGTGSIGSSGVASLSTTRLTTGTHYLQAVYGGEGTDFTGSTSPVLTLSVGGGSAIVFTGGPGSGSGSAVAFTGADIAGMVAAGLMMIAVGTVLVLGVRRRRRTARS